MSIIVTKGSLDWAYPPFILATTAAALDFEVTLFFTFYGLALLKKKLDPKFTVLGNAAMEMPMARTCGNCFSPMTGFLVRIMSMKRKVSVTVVTEWAGQSTRLFQMAGSAVPTRTLPTICKWLLAHTHPTR